MPIDFFQKVLVELVRSYREEGRPRLPEGARDHVISVVERLVAIPIVLDFYIAELTAMEPEVPGINENYALEENELEGLLEGHWKDIPDTTLSMLMLRPRTIMEVRRRARDELRIHWLKVYSREKRWTMSPQ